MQHAAAPLPDTVRELGFLQILVACAEHIVRHVRFAVHAPLPGPAADVVRSTAGWPG